MEKRRLVGHLQGMETRVRDIRKQRGMTQEDLAYAAGITQGMVSQIENGRRVRLDTLEAVASALKVDLGALFSRAQTGELPEQIAQLSQTLDPQDQQFLLDMARRLARDGL